MICFRLTQVRFHAFLQFADLDLSNVEELLRFFATFGFLIPSYEDLALIVGREHGMDRNY